MPGVIINDYSVGNPNPDKIMESLDITRRGLHKVSLKEYNTTQKPKILLGSVLECGGALIEFQNLDDEPISGTPETGDVYIVIDAESRTASFTNQAPIWRSEFQGFYAALDSANRYLNFVIDYNGSAWVKAELVAINNKIFRVYPDGTVKCTNIIVTGTLSAANLSVSGALTAGSIQASSAVIPNITGNLDISGSLDLSGDLHALDADVRTLTASQNIVATGNISSNGKIIGDIFSSTRIQAVNIESFTWKQLSDIMGTANSHISGRISGTIGSEGVTIILEALWSNSGNATIRIYFRKGGSTGIHVLAGSGSSTASIFGNGNYFNNDSIDGYSFIQL